MDAHAQIIVAAALTQSASDSGEQPGMIGAVERNTGEAAAVVLADAGYRSEAVLARQVDSAPATDVLVALGREGKRQLGIDAGRLPHSAAMAAKMDHPDGRGRYRRRKAIVEPPNERLNLRLHRSDSTGEV